MPSDEETVGIQRPDCPNCGKPAYSDAGTGGGDLWECGNGNCSVFKFFHGENRHAE